MKQKHLLSLLQSGFTTIQVIFQDDYQATVARGTAAPRAPLPRPTGQTPMPWESAQDVQARCPVYTYKAKTGTVNAGDAVIVEGRGGLGLSLALVVSVDPVARIDVDADFEYKWIIQKVDRTEYDKNLADERSFNDTMQEVERVHQREQAITKLAAHLPEGTQAHTMFNEAIARYAPTFAPQAAIGVAQAPASACTAAKAPAEDTPGMQCK